MANILGISKGQTISLAALIVFLAALLCWIGYRQRPTRQPETPEQFAQAAKDCFASGHDTYSIKEGCR